MVDLQSVAPATTVIVTAADLVYRFEGDFKAIRIRQAGVTAIADATLICGQGGRTR